MKTVNEALLLKQLEAARNGTPEEQKAYLQAIIATSNELCMLDTMMNDNDLNWLKPLALELFVPALEITLEGMHRKLHCWEEDFLDDDTKETVTILRCEVMDDATTFTPDADFEAQLHNRIHKSLGDLETNMLRELFDRVNFPIDIREMIDAELYRRDDPDAIERKGDLYRWGDEENGIFIDYATAKKYYDRIGVKFDPEEEMREYRKDATESFPDFATYRIEGADMPAVKQMLQLLYKKFGEHTEMFMYLPLEVVMKTLVGSNAYVGYIQSIEEVEDHPDAIELEVEFYGCHSDCLKYALKQAFHDLKVEFTEHGL